MLTALTQGFIPLNAGWQDLAGDQLTPSIPIPSHWLGMGPHMGVRGVSPRPEKILTFQERNHTIFNQNNLFMKTYFWVLYWPKATPHS